MMIDSISKAKHRLTDRLRQLPSIEPLIADQWIVNSLLQKSIRRDEVEIAQRGALTFLAQRGSAIWRRFMVIAFEDVGVGSVDVLAMTVAASTDESWRKQSGWDAIVASCLARALAEAPKSRSAEHLITCASFHPSLERERRLVSISSIADNLAIVADKSNSLMHRALAAWCVSGIGWKREKAPGTDQPQLLDTYRDLGVPEELVVVTGIAATKTRDPIILMAPLIWLAANAGRAATVLKAAVPNSTVVDGIPMYALDKHTRIGLQAIRNLVKCNREIRACLEQYVEPAQRNRAAYMAAFYADAAPLASKLSWNGGDQLEALGTEADLLKVGVAPEGIEPLLQSFRANVQDLDRARVEAICKKTRGFVDEVTAPPVDGKAPPWQP
jgi:hypothetical protein